MSSLKRAFIDLNKCCKKVPCPAAEACPSGAIEREDDEYYVNSLCVGCRKCLDYCKSRAITMI